VVEGIENDRQVRALTSLGVHVGQGFLLAEPTGEAELAEQLAAAVDAVRATNDPTLL
jgi:EAL domain-containing protein (putative c-di-GMP-specific phosphodiesterase class I)